MKPARQRVIERSREDLETENFELRERVEWLEEQVSRMLAGGSYGAAEPSQSGVTLPPTDDRVSTERSGVAA